MLSYVTLEEQWRSLELFFRPETFVVWSSIIAPSRFCQINPWTYKVLVEFCQDDLSFKLDIFSSCPHISKARFDTRLVKIACNGYKI